MSRRKLAEHWIEQGFKVLPLGANKAPVSHLVPRGFHDASDRPDDLWKFQHDDCELVGIVPGSGGLVVLDVDTKFGKRGDRNLRDLEKENVEIGGAPIPRSCVVTTASGGWHIYLRKRIPEEHVGNATLCEHVDVRSDGGYVVAPGNPGWEFSGDIADIASGAVFPPVWVMEVLRAKAAAEAAPADYERPEPRMEEEWHANVVTAFYSFDPNGDRHGTMISAVAALASYELLGFAGATAALRDLEGVFIEHVSDRSSEHEAKVEFRRALEGARLRVASRESTVLTEREKDAEFIELIKANGGTEEDAEKIAAIAEERGGDKLRMYTMAELSGFDFKYDWLVRNVLITPTYGQIAGESKTLKTYMSQYLGVAVATGMPFLGRFPVDHTGPVVFFVGEGGMKGWTQRMPRIAASVGVDNVWQTRIHASFTPAPFLSPTFKNTVRDVLERIDPVLTIIDPLYAFHGTDVESSNLHHEGALLTAVAEPFMEHGSTMLILNHFNKAQGGRSLKRITMAGSGEWVDSWIMTHQREEPSLNTGDFKIGVEFGSRQWGGSNWNLDVNIGVPNAMGESEDPITLDLWQEWT